MFSSEITTDEFELDIVMHDESKYKLVHEDILGSLQEESNILYALRKMGFVTAGQEAAAVEFLEEEGIDDA